VSAEIIINQPAVGVPGKFLPGKMIKMLVEFNAKVVASGLQKGLGGLAGSGTDSQNLFSRL